MRLEDNVVLYRTILACKIGRDAVEGKTKPPAGTTAMQYAMCNLLYAVEDLVIYMYNLDTKQKELEAEQEGLRDDT